VIERTFGVLKKRFKILLLPPAYGMDIEFQLHYVHFTILSGSTKVMTMIKHSTRTAWLG
jgi:hypothetical protein